MRDIVRGHLWKIHIAFIVLFGVLAMPVWITSACADTQGARDGDHRAVWKVIDAKRAYQASATAVGPRLVLTVAHNLFHVLDAGVVRRPRLTPRNLRKSKPYHADRRPIGAPNNNEGCRHGLQGERHPSCHSSDGQVLILRH